MGDGGGVSKVGSRPKLEAPDDDTYSPPTAGTIAPARGIPGQDGGGGGHHEGDSSSKDMSQLESSIMYFLTNVNLIVPVVAAVAVIVIAIAVICVIRGRNGQPFPKGN